MYSFIDNPSSASQMVQFVTGPQADLVPVRLPKECSMVRFHAQGAGGGGGAGGVSALNTAASGGGGGAAGNHSLITVPRCFLPDVIYVYVGMGGAGSATTNGGAGNIACVRFNNSFSSALQNFLYASGGAGGSVGASGAGTGAGGATGSVESGSNNSLGNMFVIDDTAVGMNKQGQAGTSGLGSTGPAGTSYTIQTSPGTAGRHYYANGGTGGGGVTSGNATGAGGAAVAAANNPTMLDTPGGPAAGGNGSSGRSFNPYMGGLIDYVNCSMGGTGGGGNSGAAAQGGTGGNGGLGSGGGGGGGSNGASAVRGRGGDGGHAYVLIICY